MPFGKHKGKFIHEINDLNYFHWLIKNIPLEQNLYKAIKFKLQ